MCFNTRKLPKMKLTILPFLVLTTGTVLGREAKCSNNLTVETSMGTYNRARRPQVSKDAPIPGHPVREAARSVTPLVAAAEALAIERASLCDAVSTVVPAVRDGRGLAVQHGPDQG